MIKGDTANLLKRNSMPDKFMETLSVLKGEQQENHKRQGEFLNNLPIRRRKPCDRYRRGWSRFPLPSGTGWTIPILSVTDIASA